MYSLLSRLQAMIYDFQVAIRRRFIFDAKDNTALQVMIYLKLRLRKKSGMFKQLRSFLVLNIYIDADGCSVKDETYKVASRYKLKVFVVANKPLIIPLDELVQMKVVSGGFDAADDWIAENIDKGDILVTSDLLLADRCIKKQASVLGSKGRELNEENIGNALAGRELGAHLRNLGHMNTGPSPMAKADRSQFLSTLDRLIQFNRKKFG
jgi:uncharacterized protein